MSRAAFETLRAAAPGVYFYRVPWWGGARGMRFQGRLRITRLGDTSRAHWLAFNPSTFRIVADKALVIAPNGTVLDFSIGARRLIRNNIADSDDYARALEFARFATWIIGIALKSEHARTATSAGAKVSCDAGTRA